MVFRVACGVLPIWLWSAAWAHAGVESQDVLKRLVENLGDRSYEVRESATKGIWSAGSSALPMLEAAAKDKTQPERMLRARDLLRKIMFELTPDTDPKVVAWVEEYEKASISEKTRLLGLLKGKRAWFPMLRLYAGEKDEEIRKKLAPLIDGAAQRAARESLWSGDAGRAKMALELGPPSPTLLMARAVLHRNQATWDEEWRKLNETERKSPWGLALLRAADRTSEAREAAAEAGDKRLAAWMGALDGDPLDWLDVVNSGAEGLEAEYVKMAQRRWIGERIADGDWARMTRRAMGAEGSTRFAATQSLFLLARTDLAEPALADHSPLSAFLYFENLEKIDEAFKSVGLDPQQPDYRSWFSKRFETYRTQSIENQHAVSDLGSEIVAMAGFMERKGLTDELWNAFARPLSEYGANEQISFVDFLSQLFGGREAASGAPLFAARVASQWAGDDEGRWSDVLNCAFGDGEDTKEWWEALGKADARLNKHDRLLVQMALFRIGPDPRGLRARWIERLLKDAKKSPELAGLLHRLALASDDASLFAKVEPLVDPAVLEELFWGVRIHHLSAVERWNDVAEVILVHIGKQAESGRPYTPEIHAHAYLAAALRLAGRADEAAKHDALVESLYLGEPSYALRIGHGYAYGRDYDRAMVWWKRACVEGGGVDDSESTQAMKVLADAWMQRGEWLRAASISECLVRIYANPDYRWESPVAFTQLRLQADTARAISRLRTNREAAVADLQRIHQAYLTDGALADVFFPSLRAAGLRKEHDKWFDKTWARFREVIRRYPDADNPRNTAAWIASRSVRALDEALLDIKAALAKRPNQAAYLDTMAEIQFAMGNRTKAVEWSSKAMAAMPGDSIIRLQHARFLNSPLPK